MRQSVQHLSPIGLAFNCCVWEFFSKIQLYSVVRMNEPLRLAKATTTESLLELDSVLDVSVSNWNQELAAGSGSSLSTNAEPISGTKDPTNHLNLMQNWTRAKKHLLLALTLQRKQWSRRLEQNPAIPQRGKACQTSDVLVAAYSNLPLQAKVQPQTWLPSSKRLFPALLWKWTTDLAVWAHCSR